MFIRSINWLYQHWQCELPVGSIWEEPWGGEGWPDYMADHMLVLMVHGWLSHLHFSYAWFPCWSVDYSHHCNLPMHNSHALTCQGNRYMIHSGRLLVGLRCVGSVSWHWCQMAFLPTDVCFDYMAHQILVRQTLCTKFLTPTVKTETCILCVRSPPPHQDCTECLV